MKTAFTLVEILIVIAILAILAVIVFTIFDPAERIQDAQDAKVINDIDDIQKSFTLWTVDNGGNFPQLNDTTALEGSVYEHSSIPTGSNCSVGPTRAQTDFTDQQDIFPNYLRDPIADPFTNSTGAYRIFLYSPSKVIVACGILSDGNVYYSPPLN